MKDHGLVSIVMATYNGEQYLSQQIDSILKQTYSNFELIVVDDASTDRTLEILDNYSKFDARVKVYSSEINIGLIKNFERGLMLANGDYLALSDQDDVFANNKIEILVNSLIQFFGCDLVVSDLRLIEENGCLISDSMWRYQNRSGQMSGHPFQRLIYDNFATGCAMMFTRRLRDLCIPFPNDCMVHDWWIAVVASSHKSGGICIIDNALVDYRQHSNNVIGAVGSDPFRFKNMVKRVFSSPRGREKVVWYNEVSKLNLKRLNGYRSRDLWNDHEMLIFSQIEHLIEGYLSDEYSNLLKQISKIPLRLRYAILTGNRRKIVDSVVYTIFPLK